MKINLKSGKEINPMRTGKRVRTCLSAGEKYPTKEDFLLAFAKSSDDFDTFKNNAIDESIENDYDSINSIVAGEWCYNTLKTRNLVYLFKDNIKEAEYYMKKYCPK